MYRLGRSADSEGNSDDDDGSNDVFCSDIAASMPKGLMRASADMEENDKDNHRVDGVAREDNEMNGLRDTDDLNDDHTVQQFAQERDSQWSNCVAEVRVHVEGFDANSAFVAGEEIRGSVVFGIVEAEEGSYEDGDDTNDSKSGSNSHMDKVLKEWIRSMNEGRSKTSFEEEKPVWTETQKVQTLSSLSVPPPPLFPSLSQNGLSRRPSFSTLLSLNAISQLSHRFVNARSYLRSILGLSTFLCA